ncbi:DUF4192 domain-containing protein [Arthrobacter sp. Soil736]|uniref:DUF4192 domain-containing protein n=1 Tax=Arthrobacter sp. Soil736 TaxID=1736395 RepID=UPI000A96B627|nr:DUF4192 domain-containing protein [Arthrobacter sp. Soil736]
METLTIKSPADLLSFIGHSLGFWPHESLVCITVDTNRIGATLRVDLPRHDGGELGYARTVAGYLTHDPNATSVLFALYTSTPWEAGQPKPRAAIIAALTGVLAERGITISDGLLVGDQTCTQYDGDPRSNAAIPLTATQTNAINAEFIYRGSSVEETDRITLPAPTKNATQGAAVKNHMETIRALPGDEAIDQARKLWASMLDTKTYPTDDQIISLIANFQFAGIRDHLIAEIPGIKEPAEQVLFAQTQGKPQWLRVEWAQQLLLHAYTRTNDHRAAPLLTALAYINWWEGRGSKAHQFLQLALEADPEYRLARLSDRMIGCGIIAGWSTDKNTAYRPQGLEGP